jgi:mRNA interferase MazF
VAFSQTDRGLQKDSKAQVQQIGTNAKERIAGPVIGRLRAGKLRDVDAAIRLYRGL